MVLPAAVGARARRATQVAVVCPARAVVPWVGRLGWPPTRGEVTRAAFRLRTGEPAQAVRVRQEKARNSAAAAPAAVQATQAATRAGMPTAEGRLAEQRTAERRAAERRLAARRWAARAPAARARLAATAASKAGKPVTTPIPWQVMGAARRAPSKAASFAAEHLQRATAAAMDFRKPVGRLAIRIAAHPTQSAEVPTIARTMRTTPQRSATFVWMCTKSAWVDSANS